VNVSTTGEYKISGKSYSEKQLEALLQQESRKNPDMQSVQIRADERVAFRYPAKVMGICEREKIKHSCAVKQGSPQSSMQGG
jgi:biopolymer transport protein ExbD